MAVKGHLSKPELFVSLPISLLLIGVALWNWSHGFSHLLNWFWLLIGVNRLFFLAQKVFPQAQNVLRPLALLSAFALILLAAYTAVRYFWQVG